MPYVPRLQEAYGQRVLRPGLVQPHGLCVLIAKATAKILAVSKNCAAHLGRTPEALLGTCLLDLMDARSSASFREELSVRTTTMQRHVTGAVNIIKRDAVSCFASAFFELPARPPQATDISANNPSEVTLAETPATTGLPTCRFCSIFHDTEEGCALDPPFPPCLCVNLYGPPLWRGGAEIHWEPGRN